MTALLNRSRRFLVVLALALGVTLAFATALPASANAETSERRDYFGAISIDKHGAWGGSYDYANKRKALKRANAECRKFSDAPGTCGGVVWVRNGCAAVYAKINAKGVVTRADWGLDRYKGPALKEAKKKCGKSCQKIGWVCTTRP